MPILTPVIKLVVFRQSLPPHSFVAFLVEFLCFVLDLLDNEKDLAKIFGIVCACDTLIFTLLDLIQNLIEEEVKLRRYGRVFWLYTKNGSLYWHTLNAYLLMLCLVHVIGSVISYVFRGHYLVLLPLFAAGLELVPQDAYKVLGPDQESQDCVGPRDSPIDVEDRELEDYDMVNQESVQDPLDGVELEQGVVDHTGSLQSPLDGIEIGQEVVNYTGPIQGRTDDIDVEEEVVVQIGPNCSP